VLQQLKIGDFAGFVDVAKPKLMVSGGGRWHILITEPNREEMATKGLSSRGFAPYSPVVYKRIRSGRTKSREVPRPMFICYAFLQLPSGFGDFDRILKVPGVYQFMTTVAAAGSNNKRDFATLPEEAIAAIRARERAIEGLRKGRTIKSTNGGEFEIGQQVAVPVGPFDKLAGKIIGVAGKDVEVLLEMEILGRRNVTVEDSTLIAAGYSQA
jgi:transcription antitermination factor NusG